MSGIVSSVLFSMAGRLTGVYLDIETKTDNACYDGPIPQSKTWRKGVANGLQSTEQKHSTDSKLFSGGHVQFHSLSISAIVRGGRYENR